MSGIFDTNGAVAYWREHSELAPDILDAAIGAAIDALYESRDAGGNMHAAGAAAAVAALQATGVHLLREDAAAREDLADRLNSAWAELRQLPLGGRGHLVDIYLEAAAAVRPGAPL